MRAASRSNARGALWPALLACACACAACVGAERAPNAPSHADVDAPSQGAAQKASSLVAAPLRCDSAVPVTQAEVDQVVARRCTSCHSPNGMAGEDYDWTNERSLLAHRRNVAAQIAESSMPPAGYPQPSADERRTLLCWAQASASASTAGN